MPRISRYDIGTFFPSARRHGIVDEDIEHVIGYALVAADDEEGKVLYLGPDRAGNLVEVVSVIRGRR